MDVEQHATKDNATDDMLTESSSIEAPITVEQEFSVCPGPGDTAKPDQDDAVPVAVAIETTTDAPASSIEEQKVGSPASIADETPTTDIGTIADAAAKSMAPAIDPIPSADAAAKSTAPAIDPIPSADAAAKSTAPAIDPIPGAKSSLGLLVEYGSSASEAEDDNDHSEGRAQALTSTHMAAKAKLNRFLESGDYRVISDSSEEDESDDDADSDDSDVVVGPQTVLLSDDDDSDAEHGPGKKHEPLKARGEIGIQELPPIEDLKITVPEDECVQFGKVSGIVEQLVLVEALKTVGNAAPKPLDLETVLFLDRGQTTLGRVFDVLGNISEPMYCVRFNTNAEIVERGVQIGQPVYVAPDRSEHTQYIILGNLMRERGCDASWEHDIEAPDRFVEFSDDEEERNARKVRRGKKPAAAEASGAGLDAAPGSATAATVSSNSFASYDGPKRHRNADDADARPAYNSQSQRGGGRFANGRGGARGGFRGPAPHHHQLQQQQQQQQRGVPHQAAMHHGVNQPQQWMPHDNYSWHTNLPYGNGGGVVPPPQPGYYAAPPPMMMQPPQQTAPFGYAAPYAYSAGPPQPAASYGAPMYGMPMHPQGPHPLQYAGPVPQQQQPPPPPPQMYQQHMQQTQQHRPHHQQQQQGPNQSNRY